MGVIEYFDVLPNNFKIFLSEWFKNDLRFRTEKNH